MLKNVSKIIAVFIFGVSGGIFADQILWPYFIERPLFQQYRLEQRPIYVTETKEVLIQENVALKDAAEKTGKAILGIKSKTKTGKVLEGTGITLSSDGLAVTLAENMPQGAVSNVYFDGQTADFQILKRDAKINLALIKLTGKTNLPTTGLFDLGKLRIGERVFLEGIIFKKENVQKFINEGIIKNLDDNLIITNIIEVNNIAGVPIFDIEGNLIGLGQGSGGGVSGITVKKIKEFAGF